MAIEGSVQKTMEKRIVSAWGNRMGRAVFFWCVPYFWDGFRMSKPQGKPEELTDSWYEPLFHDFALVFRGAAPSTLINLS